MVYLWGVSTTIPFYLGVGWWSKIVLAVYWLFSACLELYPVSTIYYLCDLGQWLNPGFLCKGELTLYSYRIVWGIHLHVLLHASALFLLCTYISLLLLPSMVCIWKELGVQFVSESTIYNHSPMSFCLWLMEPKRCCPWFDSESGSYSWVLVSLVSLSCIFFSNILPRSGLRRHVGEVGVASYCCDNRENAL